jgi:hypothetical protein
MWASANISNLEHTNPPTIPLTSSPLPLALLPLRREAGGVLDNLPGIRQLAERLRA